MDSTLDHFSAHLADLRLSPRTTARYLRVLNGFQKHMASILAGQPWTPGEVSQEHLAGFLRGREGQPAATSTQNVSLAALRAFFAFLHGQGKIKSNPAINLAFAQVHAKEPVFLSIREYQRLLSAIARLTPPRLFSRNEAMVVILFNTGLRVSELASLTLDKLDYGTKAFRNVPLKGGDFGSVEWNRETERVLTAWLETRKSWPSSKEVKALFVTEQGNPLSVRAIQEMFHGYNRALKLKKRVTPHVLRHSMATELLRQGYDIRVIAGLLHHASLNSTKRYTHLVDSLRREALASLEPPKPRRRRRP